MIDRYAERLLRQTIASDRAHAATLLVWLGGVLEMERALEGERQRVEAEAAGAVYGRYRAVCDQIARTEAELAWHLGERERARRAAA